MANPNPVKRTPPASGRWKKGQSGNPSGLSKTMRYRMAINAALAALDESGDPQKTREKVAAAHVALAMAGDMTAIKELYDREDGKVPQAITNDPEGREFVVRWMKPGEKA